MNLTEYCKQNNLSNLLKEWDYDKNEGITPSDIPANSEQEVYWKCNKGHSYKQKVCEKIKGKKCPQCKLFVWIIILSALLLISVCALGASHIYKSVMANNKPSTVVIPDNIIGEDDESMPQSTEQPSTNPSETSAPAETHPADTNEPNTKPEKVATSITLYKGHKSDNSPMNYQNMLPGDCVTNYYCLKAYHDKDINVLFKATVTGKTNNLDKALKIRVTHLDTNTVFCDDYFESANNKDFSELFKLNGNKETEAYYKVDVYLDTSVGNEYQASLLKADFEWYVTDDGGLIPSPQTGDTSHLMLWFAIAVISGSILIILCVIRRKEERQGA